MLKKLPSVIATTSREMILRPISTRADRRALESRNTSGSRFVWGTYDYSDLTFRQHTFPTDSGGIAQTTHSATFVTRALIAVFPDPALFFFPSPQDRR